MIIDRFEGEFAVVELDDGSFVNMPKVVLPEDVREDDIIIIQRDEIATDDRKNNIKKRMDGLFMD